MKSTVSLLSWRVFSRVVLTQTFMVLLALGASGLAAHYFFKKQFTIQFQSQLKDTLQGVANQMPWPLPLEWCTTVTQGTGLRVTVIGVDGRVYCDSHEKAEQMQNHGTRPEVQAALTDGYGQDVRESQTLGLPMMYSAQRQARNELSVLRVAAPLTRLDATLRVYDTSLFFFLIAVALALFGFAIWTGRAWVLPLNNVFSQVQSILKADPSLASEGVEREFRRDVYGEWADLETSIDSIRKDLQTKVEALSLEREQQATLMSAISDAILAIDLEGNPLFYNSRMAILAENGLTEGKRIWETFREPAVLDAFRSALRLGQPQIIQAMFFNRGPRGDDPLYFSVAISPLRRSRGEVYGAVGVFHDVTELKRAEQMRIDFVANVSHELRTPLTAIKGYTDTLNQDLADGRPLDPDHLKAVARNSARLMTLINDLLDLSSLESSEALNRAEVSTEQVTSRVLEQLRGGFSEKAQQVHVNIPVATVHADPGRLEQVLVNLLDNAKKYTPRGGKISVSWEEGIRGDVVLKVSDTGPGIPAEHQGRLFERFYRIDKARSREMGGTGLGLAIVKHIMQRHGGSISVESTPGQGSVFICRFPA
ncbi:MAG: sensor histidine kinase [Bacteriovoracia bacterium]